MLIAFPVFFTAIAFAMIAASDGDSIAPVLLMLFGFAVPAVVVIGSLLTSLLVGVVAVVEKAFKRGDRA